MDAILIVARLAEFSAEMVLLGTAWFALAFAEKIDGPAFPRFFRRVFRWAAAIVLVASVAWLDIEGGLMAGAWAEAANPGTVATVLFETDFGHMWEMNLAAAVVLLTVVMLPWRASWARAHLVIVAALSVLLVATSAATGHALMHGGLIHPVNQVIHVLAASAWLGSLPALRFSLKCAQARRVQPEATRHILRWYSRMGYIAVGLILVTGCVNSWFMVDGLAALVTSTYGWVLIGKIALFLVVVGVAAINRFLIVPRIADGASGLGSLTRNVMIEQALGLAVIVAISVLGTLPPAMADGMNM